MKPLAKSSFAAREFVEVRPEWLDPLLFFPSAQTTQLSLSLLWHPFHLGNGSTDRLSVLHGKDDFHCKWYVPGWTTLRSGSLSRSIMIQGMIDMDSSPALAKGGLSAS
jgi:hypothetical protein